MDAQAARSIRFSIAGLMLSVAIAGAAFAALRADSPLAADATFSVTLGVLLLAILAVFYRGGQRRAFWVGFAIFGWGYIALAFAPCFQTEVRPHLVTSRLLDVAHPHIIGLPPGTFAHFDNYWLADRVTGKWSLVKTGTGEAFDRTGHSLATLVLGLVGGMLGRCLFATRSRGERDRASGSLNSAESPASPSSSDNAAE